MVLINHVYIFFLIFFISSSLLMAKCNVAILDDLKKVKKTSIYQFISIIILVLITGFQYSGSYTDISRYRSYFYNNSHYTYLEIIRNSGDNVGFYVLGKFLYSIGGRILTFSFFAFIIILCFFLYIKEHNEHFSMYIGTLSFLFTFYYSFAFNILKQGVAVCIVLFASTYIYKNKPIHFIFTVIIASLFHGTALLSLVLWFFWDHKKSSPISTHRNLILIAISILTVAFYQNIIGILSKNDIFSDYSNYSSIIEASNRDFYVNLLLFAIFFVFRKKLIAVDNRNAMHLSLFLISIIISYLGFYNPYIKRIAFYFMVEANITLLGYLPSVFNQKERVGVKLVSTVALSIIFFLSSFSTPREFYLEFTNIP